MAFLVIEENDLIAKIGKKAKVTSKFMTSQTRTQTISINALSNISESKGNHTITFGQLIYS